MEIFQVKDHLVLLIPRRFNYSSKMALQRNSPFILVLIIFIHLTLVALALHIKSKDQKNISFETIMQLHELPSEAAVPVFKPYRPNINMEIKPIGLPVPELDFMGNNNSRLDLSVVPSDQVYELPDANTELYKDVFDPKLRKKLQEAHANRKPKRQQDLDSWRASNGTMLEDMGSGECMASMPQTDLRDRGTNWGLLRVKCGETDAEKMMDNVNADLEARKHPLKTQ